MVRAPATAGSSADRGAADPGVWTTLTTVGGTAVGGELGAGARGSGVGGEAAISVGWSTGGGIAWTGASGAGAGAGAGGGETIVDAETVGVAVVVAGGGASKSNAHDRQNRNDPIRLTPHREQVSLGTAPPGHGHARPSPSVAVDRP
jgi:hypothetical protein